MVIPSKLNKGDEIRIIAPSRNLTILSQDTIETASLNLENLGFKVTFSKNSSNSDSFMSSSIEDRISDLHDAFSDTNVKAILTVIGGYNSNQLLNYIDFELIKNNPKILCGYSDITVLLNSIYSKSDLITYLGPHFSTFGMKKGLEYTKEYFIKALTRDSQFEITPSSEWSDDLWFLDQENRQFFKSEGYFSINEGQAKGTLIGGNISSFCLLNGTNYLPKLENSILLVEGHSEIKASHFDRLLESILQQPDADKISGLLIGIPQKDCQITPDILSSIIKSKRILNEIPVIGNVNFGHTTPILTLPIGGEISIVSGNNCRLHLTRV